jgi:ParB-like chromosome segregation protein Spo0J
MTKVETRRVDELTPHPRNRLIYQSEPDDNLLERIRAAQGVRDPLTITKKNVIISGHRRWEKAKQLELPEVPVVVFESEDEAAILKELIESNLDRRAQTTRDKLLEAEALREVVEAESAIRQRGGKEVPTSDKTTG